MSSYDTSSAPMSRVVRGNPGDVGRQQIGTIETPGLVNLPAVSRGERLASELIGALNAGFGASKELVDYGNTLAVIQIHGNRLRDEEAARRERENEKLHAAFEGHGIQSGREWMATVMPGIESGQTMIAGDPATVADQMIEVNSTGLDAAGKEGFRKYAKAPLTEAIGRQQTANIKIHQEDTLTKFGESLAFSSSPASAASIISDAEQSGNTTPQQIRNMVIGALSSSANRAATDPSAEKAFNAVADAYPDAQSEIANFRQAIDSSKRTAENQKLADKNRAQDLAHQAAIDTIEKNQSLAYPQYKIMVDGFASSGAIHPKEQNDLTSASLKSAQQSAINTSIQSTVLNKGNIDDLRTDLFKRSALPPTDPSHVPVREIDNAVGDAKRIMDANESRDRVKYVFNTGGTSGVLTNADGDALNKELRTGGSRPVIDDTGRISDGNALGVSLLQAKIVPAQVKQTIVGNLTRSQSAADISNAVASVGALSKDEAMLASLRENGTPEDNAAITEAVNIANSASAADPAASAQRIRNAIDQVSKPAKLSTDTFAAMKDKLAGRSASDYLRANVLEKVRGSLGYTQRGFLLRQFDTIEMIPGTGVEGRIADWFSQAYQQSAYKGPAQAETEALTYARGMVRNKVDFVRWYGKVTPTLIEPGNGSLTMPDQYRWGEGFEDEAASDLRKARDAKMIDVDPSDIVNWRPVLNPVVPPGVDPQTRIGWTPYIADATGTLVPVTKGNGTKLVWQPTPETAKAALELRRQEQAREQAFKAESSQQYFKRTGQVQGLPVGFQPH